jgi:hypothetical protein
MQYMGIRAAPKPPRRVRLTRSNFLSLTVRTGVAVALGSVGAAGLAAQAQAASGPLADLDLALARLLVAVELLTIDFYATALGSKHVAPGDIRLIRRAAFNEGEHLTAVSQILSGAGQAASTADDFDFTYPKGSFDSRRTIARLGTALETLALGAYLGAVDSFAAGDLKTTAARIAACEAEHLSAFSRIAYGRPIGVSFPAPLDYERASAAIDPFLG